ncbi:MAG: CDP-alcohol phosphatidyltransferase family protein [Candidatus Lokiarchaeota archaeon]|nr:CDP-alcohol phosphatidyltransferase family protein [Candidatus Lokiarchaeota archaeon]
MSKPEQTNIKRSNQRRVLNKFVDLPVKLLIRSGFTPNILSFCGFFCSITVAVLLAWGGLHFPFPIAWILPFVMFWAGAFDVFDGEVARRTGNISKSGAFLDSNLDRLSDAILVLGLIMGGYFKMGEYFNYIIGFVILFLIIMISYIRARAENEGIVMKGVGFMERAERLIILWFAFIAEFWIFYLSNLLYGTPFTLFFPIFTIIFTGLLTLTIVQRLIFSFKSLSKIETQDKN